MQIRIGLADRGEAVGAAVPRARLEAAVHVAAALGTGQRRPDLLQVGVGEVVEVHLVGRELPVDHRGLGHQRLHRGARVGEHPAQGQLVVHSGVAAVVPPGSAGGQLVVRLDEPRRGRVHRLRVVVGRGHAGLLLVADHVHDRRVFVVVADRVVRTLLIDLRIEVVVDPVLVVVVDPEPAQLGVASHHLEEQVVAVLAEAGAGGQVHGVPRVRGERRGVEPALPRGQSLVPPLRVVGHVEDGAHPGRLAGGDRLTQEVPGGPATARDRRRPRPRVAEPAVERREHEVLQVQLLRLVHPVVGVPTAVGDVGLPLAAACVLRCGALTPMQEEATDRVPEELLPRVLKVGVRRRRVEGE